MKKRPSLLDIELFAGKRAEEKQQELQKIEEESDAAVFESLQEEPPPEPLPTPPEPSPMMDERVDSLIETTDTHRNEIDKLKQDLFKVKEQLRVYHSFLSTQQKKIAELEAQKANRGSEQGVVDANYIKLLLKNVVWLKEERDFSSNDVSRLFRAEGFEIPHPYEQWDADMIDILYHEAKKSFL